MASLEMMRDCEHHARSAALTAADMGLDPTVSSLWLVAVGIRRMLHEYLGEGPLIEYQLAGEAFSHIVKILMQRNVDLAAVTMTDEQLAQFKEATNAIMRRDGLLPTQ